MPQMLFQPVFAPLIFVSSSSYSMGLQDAWIGRKYGAMRVGSRLLAVVFLAAFIVVAVYLLYPLLVMGEDTLLAKIGTTTSIIGVFLGTYIALWLVNQNHTRKIEENYFYKVSLLTHLERILLVVNVYDECIDSIRRKAGPESTSRGLLVWYSRNVEDHQSRIEAINSNAFVPADIRASVESMMHAVKPVRISEVNDVKTEPLIGNNLLCPLDKVINSEYFTDDCSDGVRDSLKSVNQRRKDTERIIAPQQ